MGVVEIVASLVKLLGSEAGQAILKKLFVDAGITQEKLDLVVMALKEPPPPKEKE